MKPPIHFLKTPKKKIKRKKKFMKVVCKKMGKGNGKKYWYVVVVSAPRNHPTATKGIFFFI